MSAPSAAGSGVLNKGTTYGATSAVTSTNINAHVDNAVFNANAVDDSTLSINSSGQIFVKDAGVTGAKIGSNVALAGNPTTTTQSAGNSTTRIATTAFVRTEIPNMFTPTSYDGEENIVLPNGVIMKVGVKDVTSESSPYTLTFGAAFNNATIYAQVTQFLNSDTLQSPVHIKSTSAANMVIAFDTDVTHLHYFVIGK